MGLFVYDISLSNQSIFGYGVEELWSEVMRL